MVSDSSDGRATVKDYHLGWTGYGYSMWSGGYWVQGHATGDNPHEWGLMYTHCPDQKFDVHDGVGSLIEYHTLVSGNGKMTLGGGITDSAVLYGAFVNNINTDVMFAGGNGCSLALIIPLTMELMRIC